MQSYEQFESMEDGGANEKHIKKEIKKKIQTDPDYRKQLLLRVLPKFDKLDQFDKIQKGIAQKNTEGSEVSRSAAHLIRQINQSLGKNDNVTQENQVKNMKTITPKQSMA